MSNLLGFGKGLMECFEKQAALTITAAYTSKFPSVANAGLFSRGGSIHRWASGYQTNRDTTAPSKVTMANGSKGTLVPQPPPFTKGEYGGARVHGGMNVSSAHQATIRARPEAGLRAQRKAFVQNSRASRAFGRKALVGGAVLGAGLLAHKIFKKRKEADEDEQ